MVIIVSNKRRSLRIAVLGTRGIPGLMGGVETHCLELYPRLVELGHTVTILGRGSYLDTERTYTHKGVTVVPIWTIRKKNLEAIVHTFWGLCWIAKRRNMFDLLHIHAIGPSLLIPFAMLLKIPVVMTHHGPDYDRQKWGRFAKLVLHLGERTGCCLASAVIAVSKHIASLIKAEFKRIAVYIPNGVNLPNIVQPGSMLVNFNLTPKKYILTVGRLVPEKGFHDLISAFMQLETEWNLVIVGDTDHEDEYSSDLKAMAVNDKRIKMTGFIRGNDLAEIYSNAGLFVLPSYHEGLPIALLEAISYNLPILASDISANCELAGDSEVFPLGNVNLLTEQLKQKTSNPGNTAIAYAKLNSEFNWEIIAKKTEEIYYSVIT